MRQELDAFKEWRLEEAKVELKSRVAPIDTALNSLHNLHLSKKRPAFKTNTKKEHGHSQQTRSKQTNKRTSKQTNTSNKNNHTNKKQTSKQASKQASKQTSKQTNKQANKQTNKQKTNKQASKQANKQASKQTNKQTNKQANKQTNKQTSKQAKHKTNNTGNTRQHTKTRHPIHSCVKKSKICMDPPNPCRWALRHLTHFHSHVVSAHFTIQGLLK